MVVASAGLCISKASSLPRSAVVMYCSSFSILMVYIGVSRNYMGYAFNKALLRGSYQMVFNNTKK